MRESFLTSISHAQVLPYVCVESSIIAHCGLSNGPVPRVCMSEYVIFGHTHALEGVQTQIQLWARIQLKSKGVGEHLPYTHTHAYMCTHTQGGITGIELFMVYMFGADMHASAWREGGLEDGARCEHAMLVLSYATLHLTVLAFGVIVLCGCFIVLFHTMEQFDFLLPYVRTKRTQSRGYLVCLQYAHRTSAYLFPVSLMYVYAC